jgi:DNA modification methylase
MNIHCKYDELVNPKDLKPHPKNRNKHSADQIDRLAKLYEFHGIRHPIIISKLSGHIVAGHGRREAAIKANLTEMPVVYQEFTDEKAEYAFIQADNAIALWAELDLSGINDDIADLGPDFDIDLLGIKNFEIDVADKDFEADEDEVPEARPEPKVVQGEVYILGNHRLMCGDSTIQTDYDQLMIGETPLLMVTDPPYGVKLDQSWRDKALGDKALGKGNANLVSNDDRADWYDVWAISNAQIAYVWHASAFTDVVMDSLRRAGFEVKQQIIWNKSVMVMGRQAYHWKHEPCWYAVRKGADQNWVGDRKQVTVWDAAPPTHIMGGSKEDKTEHPTQKPILVYEIPIENHTRKNDLMYEPFSGSGSAFIAGEKHGRRVYGMELDPIYCGIILDRWQKFTGKTAHREDGKPWDEIKVE